jgi:hypothetical protein
MKATVEVKDTHLDSTAVVFLFPTHYSTIPHERGTRFRGELRTHSNMTQFVMILVYFRYPVVTEDPVLQTMFSVFEYPKKRISRLAHVVLWSNGLETGKPQRSNQDVYLSLPLSPSSPRMFIISLNINLFSLFLWVSILPVSAIFELFRICGLFQIISKNIKIKNNPWVEHIFADNITKLVLILHF